MKFCTKCNFMLYVKIIDNKLTYECKNCGHIAEPEEHSIDNCIYSKNYTTDTVSYLWMVNKDLCTDPTIPHVSNIPCPNDEVDDSGTHKCPSKRKEKPAPNEVIYVLFDKNAMKYFYMCCNCYTTWKHE